MLNDAVFGHILTRANTLPQLIGSNLLLLC